MAAGTDSGRGLLATIAHRAQEELDEQRRNYEEKRPESKLKTERYDKLAEAVRSTLNTSKPPEELEAEGWTMDLPFLLVEEEEEVEGDTWPNYYFSCRAQKHDCSCFLICSRHDKKLQVDWSDTPPLDRFMKPEYLTNGAIDAVSILHPNEFLRGEVTDTSDDTEYSRDAYAEVNFHMSIRKTWEGTQYTIEWEYYDSVKMMDMCQFDPDPKTGLELLRVAADHASIYEFDPEPTAYSQHYAIGRIRRQLEQMAVQISRIKHGVRYDEDVPCPKLNEEEFMNELLWVWRNNPHHR